MIISHAHKFIFIKTRKTAGTSLEVYLSQHCGPEDVLTPINPPETGHLPRNYTGYWNPIPEVVRTVATAPSFGLRDRVRLVRRTMRQLPRKRAFYNHIPGHLVRSRISRSAWESYFKFTIERNPWDKTLSHYYYIKARSGRELAFGDYLAEGDFCFNYPIYSEPGKADRVIVDRVLRYERLNEELGEVLRMLGIPYAGSLGVRAKSSQRSNKAPYQEVYEPWQRDIIERAFETEISLFGYQF